MSKSLEETLMESLLTVLLLLGLVTVFTLEPFVIARLWFWFVVPLGVRSINWAQALGLDLLVGLLVFRYVGKRTTEESLRAILTTVASSVFTLVVGWVLATWFI